MTRQWSGIQKLTRPIPMSANQGLLVDIFYRRRLKLWVVWAFVPPDEDKMFRSVAILGGFKNRAQARFAADTALVAAQHSSSVMPMFAELLADAEGDFLGVLHSISHVADVAPWACPHMNHANIMSRLGPQDLERLTQQIEQHQHSVQDWRFMWVAAEGSEPCPSLIRIRNNAAAAAVVLEPSTFAEPTVKFWLDAAEHQIPCKPTPMADNPLATPVLDNLADVMQYCDKILRERYGADSNARELIELLREEGLRESTRQIARAFGTGGFVGEA